MLNTVLRALARLWPGPVDVDDDLKRALAFIDAGVDGGTVHRASYVSAVALSLAGFLLALAGVGGAPVAVPFLVVGLGVATGAPTVPLLLARARRTRALGRAPSLVSRAVLSMELSPSPERAARFAAESDEGVLATSLAGHVDRAAGGPHSGLASFASEWAAWFPELERACSLVESAGSVPADQRKPTLDRARTAVLDATRDRMAEFAASIRGPATAVYAFGVLLPLALVSLLPALQAAGVPASLELIAVVYDVLLPLALVAASGWLLSRRPVAFPPPTVGRSHPDVPASRWRAPLTGVLAGAVAWWATPLLLPGWAAPLATLGAGVGIALVVRFRPAVGVRESVRAVEDGLSDAFALLGRRVERGESIESAVPAVADELPGPTGDVLAEAARRQRTLGLGVEASFLGPDGALADVPSPRARSGAVLLGLAANEGRPAGGAVTAMGDHLQELATVEAEARRSVDQVCRTLSNTAAVFGPLVGGATVALAGAMGTSGPLAGGEMTAGLGLAIGVYVLVLAVVLTALSTGLSRGFDRSLVGYRAGIAMLAATATYLAAFVGTGLTV
jgi:Flp pilus assembly protein TadB